MTMSLNACSSRLRVPASHEINHAQAPAMATASTPHQQHAFQPVSGPHAPHGHASASALPGVSPRGAAAAAPWIPATSVGDNADDGDVEEEGSPAASSPSRLGSGWFSGAAKGLADLSTPRRRQMLEVCMSSVRTCEGGPWANVFVFVACAEFALNTDLHPALLPPQAEGPGIPGPSLQDETELSRSFHHAVALAEEESVAPASSLALESNVGVLGMSELDDLLARLQAGRADLAAGGSR